MNSACPLWPSSSSTTALTTCTLAMPPLPIHILWPSMIQSSPSRCARVRRLRTSLPPSGSEIASAASLRSPGRAEAFGRPLQHLLGRGGLADRRQRQRGHHDRQPDSGAAPEQLLHEHRQRQAGRIADEVAVEQRAVEAAVGGLLQHRPRELLALVVVARHRADAPSSANSWVRRARSCCAAVGVISKLIDCRVPRAGAREAQGANRRRWRPQWT